MANISPPENVLVHLVERETAVWEPGATTGAIELRNESARVAIAAGWSPEEIARRVGVKPVDVRRWADAVTV